MVQKLDKPAVKGPKWGVALSGGGVPGIAAHLGFMKGLIDNGLTPPILVGTSAGGLVAGGLAVGSNINQLLTRWESFSQDFWQIIPRELLHLLELVRPVPTPGLLDLSECVSKAMQGFFLMLPLSSWCDGYGVMVSDLTDGVSKLLDNTTPISLNSNWSTEEAITATAAIPGLFSGVRGPDHHLYCDGGLYDMTPVAACHQLGAEKILAVQIGAPTTVPASLSLEQLLGLVITRGLTSTNSATNPQPADMEILIRIQGGLISFEHFQNDLSVGRQLATINLDRIRALVGSNVGSNQ